MKEQWRQQMRQKMADYRQPAPEVSWDEIEKAVAAHNRQTKKVAMWPRRIAAAVLVLVTGGIGYYLLNRQEPDAVQLMESVVREQSGEGIRKEPVNPQQKIDNQTFASVKHQIERAVKSLVTKDDTIAVVANTEEAQIAMQASEVQATETQEQKTEVQPQKKTLSEVQTIYPSDIKRSASSNKRLMAKVYLSNAMLGNSGYSSYEAFSGQKVTSDLQLANSEYNSESPSSTDSFSQSLKEKEHHRQPIRFGLSLRYILNDKWSIDGGLSYTLLTSDISLSSGDYSANIEQRLNYVGIPISVNYQLWSNRRFNVYASAGGIVEKMVKGKQHIVVTNPSKSEKDESVSIGPLQLSINGAIGAEYQFVDWLSIYAEPGLGYYFDNGSSVPTIYQDKPLNFNLNVGLRLNIK